ncbi:MAG TPA: DegQ family serine endoprotease [Candidatus Tectomicrobia bacterium]|jgi:serine protease Do|nr:DegQ family serine endoprotease [Candidatus Tectomicrobia bacterium]
MDEGIRMRYASVRLICLLVSIAIAGTLAIGSGAAPPFWTESPPAQTPRVQAPNFADLAEQLQPAVVNISTTQVLKGPRRGFRGFPSPRPFEGPDPFEEFFERFFGGTGPQRELRRRSLGSGVIINKDGHIVTNNHVVENATDIKVSLSDKEEFDATVVGRDAKTDVALIKIEAKRDLPVAPLGDSERLRVGEWVLAIGNPFGLGHTVTVGITSAKGRIIGAGPYDNFIQTDASINPGNSGGPLFNLNGEVVGINTAIVASGQGIGFAIPINLAKEILTQLREQGRVTRGWLGVQVQHVTPELAQSFGLERARGALVVDVQPNSPAAGAGLQRGDVIVRFGGEEIEDMHELPHVVAMTPPGTEVDLRLIRQGEERTVQVKLGEMPEGQRQAAVGGDTPEGKLGLAVQELTPEIARSLDLPDARGVVVTGVAAGSPADEAGIRRGDAVLEVNQQKVTNLQEYRDALSRVETGAAVLFLIRRGDNVMYVALRPEDDA